MFVVGQVYNRTRDIHDRFGGQRQGGISTPAETPVIFLFTGETGQPFGYEDGWDPDRNVFLYTGEGQRGDMEFVRGNLAIRDHAATGRDLLLFQALGKSKGCIFRGTFGCASWEVRDGPDVDGNIRKVIVFELVDTEALNLPAMAPADTRVDPAASLSDLRKLAYQAVKPVGNLERRDARRSYVQRSIDIRDYVLARAMGVCESCKKDAPFQRPNGSRYLEPHHIRRLADGGPDDPRWVGAVCPNCHREAHYGVNAVHLNTALEAYVASIEIGDY